MNPPPYEERLIKLPEVLSMVGMQKTAWYDGIAAGKYPQPIRRSRRDTVWRLSVIQKLIADTIAAHSPVPQ
jgi:prophage regulatory protein